MFRFARTSQQASRINAIHGGIVAATRQTVFYLEFGVADTFEGRFEVLTLHAAVVLRHLQQLPGPGPARAQALADSVFSGLEAAMRELGVGDSVIPKRMARLLEAFSGRMRAYSQALDGDGPELAQTLARNVLAGQGDGLELAAYVRALAQNLSGVGLEQIETTRLPVPNPLDFLSLLAKTGQN